MEKRGDNFARVSSADSGTLSADSTPRAYPSNGEADQVGSFHFSMKSLPKYDEYKDSGVEWIGQIPAGWNVCRIGQILRLHSGDALNSALMQDDAPIPVYGGGDQKGNYNKANLVGENVLVSRQGATCGTVRYVNGPVWATEHALVVYQNVPLVMKWLAYALESMNLGQYSVTAAQPGISAGVIEQQRIPLPTRAEQRAIADYLDEKTAQIDELVAETEKSIDLLEEYRKSIISETVTKGLDPNAPMKDSGVEWIGEIPEGWEVVKLRRLGTMQNGISKGSEYFGSGLPFVTYGNVYRNELSNPNLFGSVQSTSSERELYSIRRGDVLFTRTSETIDEVGISAVALNDIPDSCFAGFLIRVRPSNPSALLPEYAAYYFRSDVYRPFLSKEMVLVTRASLGQQLLGNVSVLIPPLAEQRAIAAYLDERTATIDALVAQKRTLLDQLREYRKSLISEVVTGKFKVSGVD